MLIQTYILTPSPPQKKAKPTKQSKRVGGVWLKCRALAYHAQGPWLNPQYCKVVENPWVIKIHQIWITRVRGVVQEVEFLPSKYEALSSNPSIAGRVWGKQADWDNNAGTPYVSVAKLLSLIAFGRDRKEECQFILESQEKCKSNSVLVKSKSAIRLYYIFQLSICIIS
jgi:hypothetical protein